MSKAAMTVEGLVATELQIRNAGASRVVDVSVAHTPQKKVGDRWEDAGETTWVSASFWDDHADVVMDTVQKGTLVILAGEPELSLYTSKAGVPGGKVVLRFPTLSVVVRRPRKGAVPDSWVPAAVESWGDGDSSVPF